MIGSPKLTLVGCGPGQEDLLTYRAVSRIQEADVVLYDRLVDSEIIALIPEGTLKINVGKKPGDGGVQQASINDLLLTYLGQGNHVARLKSGDPLIFGRAAEEIETATQIENCEIEVVPGVTSSLAAASDSFLTVTERSELQHFVVTTGKAATADQIPDWVGMLKPGVCMAVYMGVAQAWRIQSTLQAAGLPGCILGDWVENAGKSNMRRVSTRLDRLSNDAKQNDVKNPAILFLRYPVSLFEELEQQRIQDIATQQ